MMPRSRQQELLSRRNDAGIFLQLAAFEPVEQSFTTLYIMYNLKK